MGSFNSLVSFSFSIELGTSRGHCDEQSLASPGEPAQEVPGQLSSSCGIAGKCPVGSRFWLLWSLCCMWTSRGQGRLGPSRLCHVYLPFPCPGTWPFLVPSGFHLPDLGRLPPRAGCPRAGCPRGALGRGFWRTLAPLSPLDSATDSASVQLYPGAIGGRGSKTCNSQQDPMDNRAVQLSFQQDPFPSGHGYCTTQLMARLADFFQNYFAFYIELDDPF